MERDDLAFAGAGRQAEMIRRGEVSSRELVELYLDRIRRLDPELNAFRSTWLGPKAAFVMPFIAQADGDSITLTSQTANTRWAFTGITETSFHWRNEDQADDGRVILRQTFEAKRQL